jgi:transcriptional regulator GlxA family with amidase domain
VTGQDLEIPVGESRWQPKRKALRALVDLHDNAVRLTAAHPGVATGEEAASGLEQQLIQALIDCLAVPPIHDAALSGGRAADVMGRFSDIVQTSNEQTVTIQELCAWLDVSERDLRAYCMAYLGMSPHEYLRRKRLLLARRLLRAANPETASVTEIAQRCGFNAPGRFAVIYRARFGELPSVTLGSNQRFSLRLVRGRRDSAGE